MDITERFLNYTQFDTQSSEDSQSVPSTAKQLVFAKYLKEELEREGLSDVEMDDIHGRCRLCIAHGKLAELGAARGLHVPRLGDKRHSHHCAVQGRPERGGQDGQGARLYG